MCISSKFLIWENSLLIVLTAEIVKFRVHYAIIWRQWSDPFWEGGPNCHKVYPAGRKIKGHYNMIPGDSTESEKITLMTKFMQAYISGFF